MGRELQAAINKSLGYLHLATGRIAFCRAFLENGTYRTAFAAADAFVKLFFNNLLQVIECCFFVLVHGLLLGHDFAGVQDSLGIQQLFKATHHLQRRFIDIPMQVMDFDAANAVFGRDTAFQRNGSSHDFIFSCHGEGAATLARGHAHMDIAIAVMAKIVDDDIMARGNFIQLTNHLRDTGDRHGDIVIFPVLRYLAHGERQRTSSLPKLFPLFFRTRLAEGDHATLFAGGFDVGHQEQCPGHRLQ